MYLDIWGNSHSVEGGIGFAVLGYQPQGTQTQIPRLAHFGRPTVEGTTWDRKREGRWPSAGLDAPRPTKVTESDSNSFHKYLLSLCSGPDPELNSGDTKVKASAIPRNCDILVLKSVFYPLCASVCVLVRACACMCVHVCVCLCACSETEA